VLLSLSQPQGPIMVLVASITNKKKRKRKYEKGKREGKSLEPDAHW